VVRSLFKQTQEGICTYFNRHIHLRKSTDSVINSQTDWLHPIGNGMPPATGFRYGMTVDSSPRWLSRGVLANQLLWDQFPCSTFTNWLRGRHRLRQRRRSATQLSYLLSYLLNTKLIPRRTQFLPPPLVGTSPFPCSLFLYISVGGPPFLTIFLVSLRSHLLTAFPDTDTFLSASTLGSRRFELGA